MNGEKVVYPLPEVAKVLGLTVPKVRELIECGKLAAERSGDDYVVEDAVLEKFYLDGINPANVPNNRTAQPDAGGALRAGLKPDAPAEKLTPDPRGVPNRPQTNRNDIRRFLDLIMVDDGIIEVRAIA